jgi:hypothetical protein
VHRTAENTADAAVTAAAGVIVVPAAGAMTGMILMIVALIGVVMLLVPLIRTLTRVLIARCFLGHDRCPKRRP